MYKTRKTHCTKVKVRRRTWSDVESPVVDEELFNLSFFPISFVQFIRERSTDHRKRPTGGAKFQIR